MDIKKSVITLTFGDQAENHKGMQKLGDLVNEGEGFNLDDLLNIKEIMESKNANCELVDLKLACNIDDKKAQNAYLLIIRNGVNIVLDYDKAHELLFEEQSELEVDKKAFMYGRVVNKNARWNLCFDTFSQEPEYEEGKGRVVNFDDVIVTKSLWLQLGNLFGEKAKELKCEGNYYYDVKNCGIGYHGDSERRKVIGVRLGSNLNLHYQWYYKGNSIGDNYKAIINGGDIYIMSEKAVGTDWKRKNIYTIRHAAGCKKFVEIK